MLVICGNAIDNSRTQLLCNKLAQLNADTNLIDLKDKCLPIVGLPLDEQHRAEIDTLKAELKKHNEVIIVTPEFHGAISGALKNFLDYFSKEDFYDKKVFMLGTAGGNKGGINALNNLRLIMRSLGALVISDQIVFDPEDIDKTTGQINEMLLNRTLDVINKFTMNNLVNN